MIKLELLSEQHLQYNAKEKTYLVMDLDIDLQIHPSPSLIHQKSP
jgi:hypothetical protein